MSANMEALEAEHLHAQIAKLISEAGKLQAEQAKLNREARWYPFIAMAAFAGAVAAVAKLFYGA